MTQEALEQLVTTLYSEVLNPKLDFVESVYFEDNGELEVFYFYDNEEFVQKFSSLKKFLLECSTHCKM